MKFFNRQKQQSGMTLVEILIVMGILALFLTVLTDILVTVVDVRTEADATSAVAEDGRYLLARLSYDIQRASAVTTPAALGGSGGTLVLTIGGIAHTYTTSSNNLQMTNNLGSINLNGDGTTVSGLTFHRLGNISGKDTVRVTFTVTSTTRDNQGFESETYTTTVGRR